MSSVATLRAMAVNYANGHNWDYLDTEACIKAAAEIEQLTKQRDELIRVSLAGFKSIAAISGGLVSDLALMSIKNIEAIASVKGD